MMSEQQRQALSVLADIWELSPDVRLGQLFAHLGFLGENHLDRGLGDIDDDELLSVMYKHCEELLARLQAPQSQQTPTVVVPMVTHTATADPPKSSHE